MPTALARTANNKKAIGASPRRVVRADAAIFGPTTGRIGCSPSAQSDPPLQCSCFQIGAVSFSVSMQYRAASNASSRCGDETATATDGSDKRELTDTVQQRDPLERRASGGAPRRRSRPSRGAPALRRPRRSSRAHPRALRRDRARHRRSRRRHPSRGVVAHECSASTGSAASVSATQSRTSFGGESTANSLRKDPRRSPGAPNRRPRPRSRTRNASLHSIAMGFGGDDHGGDEHADGTGSDDDGPGSAAPLASRPARSALAAPERALAARRPSVTRTRSRSGRPPSSPAPPARS